MREIMLEEAKRNPMVYPNIRPIHKENRIRRAGKKRFKLSSNEKVKLDFEENRFLPTIHINRAEDDKLIYIASLWIDSPVNIRNATTSYLSQVAKRLRQESIKAAPIFHVD
jgi:hypothetical protein